MSDSTLSLASAREQADASRALHEILEQRFNGKTWSLHELQIGFANDVGIAEAFTETMDRTRAGLKSTIARTAPPHPSAADRPRNITRRNP